MSTYDILVNELLKLMEEIARSEGLFLWKSDI